MKRFILYASLFLFPVYGFSQTEQSFTDNRDGHVYKCVKIGNQIWMAENLAYLPQVNMPEQKSDTEPRFYVYGYKRTSVKDALASFPQEGYFSKAGVLYNWSAALEACPKGWHLPARTEWDELAAFISKDKGPYNKTSDGWSELGKHLKSKQGWLNDNTQELDSGGSDDYGFSAIPGGRLYSGFAYLGTDGYWWTSTESSGKQLAYHIHLVNSYNTFMNSYGINKYSGHCVRCVKDL